MMLNPTTSDLRLSSAHAAIICKPFVSTRQPVKNIVAAMTGRGNSASACDSGGKKASVAKIAPIAAATRRLVMPVAATSATLEGEVLSPVVPKARRRPFPIRLRKPRGRSWICRAGNYRQQRAGLMQVYPPLWSTRRARQ